MQHHVTTHPPTHPHNLTPPCTPPNRAHLLPPPPRRPHLCRLQPCRLRLWLPHLGVALAPPAAAAPPQLVAGIPCRLAEREGAGLASVGGWSLGGGLHAAGGRCWGRLGRARPWQPLRTPLALPATMHVFVTHLPACLPALAQVLAKTWVSFGDWACGQGLVVACLPAACLPASHTRLDHACHQNASPCSCPPPAWVLLRCWP